ncbi:MAG: ferredoxin [Jatrophihabitans sp.]|nr:MAG: ferredoxin [Jatrophihabitans sp.]
MRLAIDWTRCEGHGLCAALAPELIARDEWGYPLLPARDVGADDLPAARRAVAACPELALRVQEP